MIRLNRNHLTKIENLGFQKKEMKNKFLDERFFNLIIWKKWGNFSIPQCEGQVNVDKAKKNLKVIFTIANSEFQCPSLSTQRRCTSTNGIMFWMMSFSNKLFVFFFKSTRAKEILC